MSSIKNEHNNEEESSYDDDLDFSDAKRHDLHDVKSGAKGDKDDGVVFSKEKIKLVKKLLLNIQENNSKLIQLLTGTLSTEEEARISIGQSADDAFASNSEDNETAGRIVEGVFDGESMIGPDGKQYSMPANYASKSKLVEGDIMKLTITPTGTFVYKQIGPIERLRIIGTLEQTSVGNYIVTHEGKKWRVLTASVTYYKGDVGDEVVILVPKAGESNWAAIDNIVKNA
jgi:hypothetical protein